MRLWLVAAAIAGAVLVTPAGASAHAVLEETSPPRGATVEQQPDEVRFGFNEPVEGSFGAVRVFDVSGERVDEGEVTRADGGKEVAIGLRDDLPRGSYTATFRLISADAHPVTGGFVFSIGRPGAAADVAALIDEDQAGPATDVAFGAVRALSYAAIALVVGGALFLVVAWGPALRAVAGAGRDWVEAADAFGARFRRLALGAVALGLIATLLGLVLQGATAGGTSFWDALDPDVIGDVLATRFGTAWALRLPAYLVLGGLLLLRASSCGAAVLAVLALGYLLVSPALAGHASTQSPGLLLVPANIVHVAAMSAWLGGLAFLVLTVPAATRRLAGADRTRLLAAAVSRVSTVALVAVAVLLASGVTQSIVHLESLGDLTGTAFGRAILVKAGLFFVLLGLGAYNRRRSTPGLARLAADGEAPGRTGLLLRRTILVELTLMAGVLAATGALTAYPPPSAAAAGPFSASERLGPARMEVTLDPARVGRNELHLYLFDSRTGAQYDRAKELRLDMTLPERDIGPIELSRGRLAQATTWCRGQTSLRRATGACGPRSGSPDSTLTRAGSRCRWSDPPDQQGGSE